MTFTDTLWGRPNTKATYKSLYKKWIEPHFIANPNPATEKDLDKLIQFWQAKDLAPRTIKSLVTLTAKYIEWEGGGHIDVTARNRAILRLQQEPPIKALKPQEALDLLKQVEGTILHLPVLLGMHAGLRRGEAFGLTWDCVDMLKGELCICKSYNGPTKNGKTRKVSVSAQLESILFAQMELDSDNCIGKRVIVNQFDPNPRLKSACRKAGVPVITYHGLRHTFATLALEAGRSPKLVQQALGHSKVSTTVDLYWQAREQLDTSFLPGGTT